MARKELNVLSLSFLDLLSGALAAVIILFIVVPRASSEQVQAIEALERMEISVGELDSLLQVARGTIAREVYDQLTEQIAQLEAANRELREQVERLQQQVSTLQRVAQQLDSARAELQATRRQLAEARRNANQGGGSGAGQAIFGLDAELGIVASWSENVDVDLYVREKRSGEWCFFDNTRPGFATYLNDITSRTPGDTRYELVYQQKIKPGTYDVYIHLYSDRGTARVSGYAVIFPFKPNEKKVVFQQKTLTNQGLRRAQPPGGGGVKVATIRVTSNSISIE
jgi:chaperonin cofactor prefoldin